MRGCSAALLTLSLCSTAAVCAQSTPAVQTANETNVTKATTWRLYAGTNQSSTWGWTFKISGKVTLTDLGVFDHKGMGLQDSHEVGLWDGSGNLLVRVTVPQGTGGKLVGSYRYQALPSPLALKDGSTYVIGAYYGPVVASACQDHCGDYFLTDPNQTFARNIAHLNANLSGYKLGPSQLAFPSQKVAESTPGIGPNFLFTQ
jgi:Domain of unknown function (DUF4082)